MVQYNSKEHDLIFWHLYGRAYSRISVAVSLLVQFSNSRKSTSKLRNFTPIHPSLYISPSAWTSNSGHPVYLPLTMTRPVYCYAVHKTSKQKFNWHPYAIVKTKNTLTAMYVNFKIGPNFLRKLFSLSVH